MMNKMPCHMSSVLPVVALAISAAAVSLTAKAESDGWYTEAQAEEGGTLYNTYCAQCHRTDLSGAQGPALTGEKFLSRYKTGAQLYDYTNKTMPPTNPGSVPGDDLIRIMAFILSENGLPAGAELTEGNLDRPLKP
ncbi:MAG: c-type cytochrome [Gammaproteobacteria bacterium]